MLLCPPQGQQPASRPPAAAVASTGSKGKGKGKGKRADAGKPLLFLCVFRCLRGQGTALALCVPLHSWLRHCPFLAVAAASNGSTGNKGKGKGRRRAATPPRPASEVRHCLSGVLPLLSSRNQRLTLRFLQAVLGSKPPRQQVGHCLSLPFPPPFPLPFQVPFHSPYTVLAPPSHCISRAGRRPGYGRSPQGGECPPMAPIADKAAQKR